MNQDKSRKQPYEDVGIIPTAKEKPHIPQSFNHLKKNVYYQTIKGA